MAFSKNGSTKLKLHKPSSLSNAQGETALFNPITLVYLIVPLVVGLVAGYALRNRKLPKLDKASLAVILVLIFSLGFGIGSNNELIAALPQVGLQGFVIAALSIGFSITFIILGKKLVKSQ